MSPIQAPMPDKGGTDECNMTEGNNRISMERSELDSSFLPAGIQELLLPSPVGFLLHLTVQSEEAVKGFTGL